MRRDYDVLMTEHAAWRTDGSRSRRILLQPDGGCCLLTVAAGQRPPPTSASGCSARRNSPSYAPPTRFTEIDQLMPGGAAAAAIATPAPSTRHGRYPRARAGRHLQQVLQDRYLSIRLVYQHQRLINAVLADLSELAPRTPPAAATTMRARETH